VSIIMLVHLLYYMCFVQGITLC